MPLLFTPSDIKYTVVNLNEEDYHQIINSADENNNFERIFGFIRNGQLWHLDVPDGHWTNEIIAAYPDSHMMIINGSPQGVDGIMETHIVMEQDWYHQHDAYDIWQTPVGYVAVC